MDSDIPKSEPVEEAAVRWFMCQQSGAWNDADQARLDAWLDASVAHRIQYLRIKNAWEKSDCMKALGAGVAPGEIPPRDSWGDRRYLRSSGSSEARPRSARRDESSAFPDRGGGAEHADRDVPADVGERRTSVKRRSGVQVFSAAAALVLLAFAIYIIYGLLPGTQYSTAIGGIQNVALADGSRITLNTNTHIRVILSDQERQIRLDSGEAFFEVAKDNKRPFVVYVDDKRVMAVGTKFAVRRNDSDVQVVVTEGRVKLATVPIHSAEAGGPPPAVAFLDAGTIARTSHSEVLVRPGAQSEAEKLLTWRIGYVSFDNVPLAEAVAEFNRYNVRQIVIDDPAIAAVLIGGNFRSNNTEAFLDLLQSGFPISVEQRDDQVILKSR